MFRVFGAQIVFALRSMWRPRAYRGELTEPTQEQKGSTLQPGEGQEDRHEVPWPLWIMASFVVPCPMPNQKHIGILLNIPDQMKDTRLRRRGRVYPDALL